MDQREQFIKKFVEAGKASGATKEQVAAKLKPALAEYDASVQPKQGFFESLTEPSSVGAMIGDVTGELIPIPGLNVAASGFLSGAGAFGGEIYEDIRAGKPIDWKKAAKVGAVEGITSAATPFALKGGAKIIKAVPGARPLIEGGEQIVEKGGKFLSEGMEKVLGGIEKKADELPLQGVRITPNQIVKFEKETKEKVTDFISREGLSGNPIPKALEKADILQSQFDDIVKNSGVKVKTSDIVSEFDKVIDELKTGANAYSPEMQAMASKLEKRRDLFIANSAGQKELGVDFLTELRKTTDTYVKPQQFLANPELATENVTVRRIYQDIIRKATKDVTRDGKNLETIGKDLNKFYKFIEYTEKTDIPQASGKLMPTLRGAGIGVGLSTGNLLAALAPMAYESASKNPTVLNTLRKTMLSGTGTARDVAKAVSPKIKAFERALLNRTLSPDLYPTQ